MKSLHYRLTAWLGALLLAGCATQDQPRQADSRRTATVPNPEAPQEGASPLLSAAPPQRTEIVTAAPGTRYSWRPASWAFLNNTWIWVPGYWQQDATGAVWENGRWERTDRGWLWVPGEWAVGGVDEESLEQVTPVPAPTPPENITITSPDEVGLQSAEDSAGATDTASPADAAPLDTEPEQ